MAEKRWSVNLVLITTHKHSKHYLNFSVTKRFDFSQISDGGELSKGKQINRTYQRPITQGRGKSEADWHAVEIHVKLSGNSAVPITRNSKVYTTL